MLNKKSFTLIEVLVTIFTATLIFSAAWAIYAMGMTWWHEVSPRIEAQRIARLAVTKIIDGTTDSTAGQDIIGGSSFKRRNGISSTYYFAPTLPNPKYYPDGTTYSNEIDYGLFEDYSTATPSPYQPSAARNVRAFYIGTDTDSSLKVVYYKDGQSVVHKISSTLGITDLKFHRYIETKIDGSTVEHPKIIVVTATVEKEVSTGKSEPYQIKVEYKDYAYLRNVQ